MLAAAAMKTGDLVGFTFFIGTMAMFAASVFFYFERQTVSDKWKTSLLISALITTIAAAHYMYMREYYLLLKAAGASINMLWRLIGYSVLMLVAGYVGEVSAKLGQPVRGFENFGWGVISTIGWAGIVYEIFFGEAKQLADGSSDANVRKAFNLLRGFVLIGWAIYPIGYMTLPGNVLSNSVELASKMNVIYNIGDAVNKIGFGLIVWNLAKRAK
jgi:bacteriorhodopsin